MSREIKFRAWDKKEKKMRYCLSNFQIYTDGPTTGFVFWTDGYHQDWDTFSKEWTEEQPALMQFTGLLDTKGKEIWEGDIVEDDVASAGKKREVIEFKGLGIEPFISSRRYASDYQTWSHFTRPSYVEVIGNIYESPELLKESKE